jgi:hypothetical protein
MDEYPGQLSRKKLCVWLRKKLCVWLGKTWVPFFSELAIQTIHKSLESDKINLHGLRQQEQQQQLNPNRLQP